MSGPWEVVVGVLIATIVSNTVVILWGYDYIFPWFDRLIDRIVDR